MNPDTCDDPTARDEWHVIAYATDLPVGATVPNRLLGEAIAATRAPDGTVRVIAGGRALPVRLDFGYVWTTLGTPDHDIFRIPEAQEPGRRCVHAASLGVQVSAPRAVENFLDLGHFPYVHTDYLGAEPDTEVKPYEVRVTADHAEILATGCLFTQPRAAANADGAFEVEYIYRVPHPYCSVLYKLNPVQRDRMDVIALFVQPVGQEEVRAHMFLCMLDDSSTEAGLKSFQQVIFAQDKPILENQVPRRLPLDPAAEIPVRADASSVAYRRWLSQRGVRYGTIPA